MFTALFLPPTVVKSFSRNECEHGQIMTNTSELPVKHSIPGQEPRPAIKHSTIRPVIRDNAKQITHAVVVSAVLTITIYGLLPLINKIWLQGASALIDWLQLELSVSSSFERIPFITAPVSAPLLAHNYAWHLGIAVLIIVIAKVLLHPPFRAAVMAVAGLHILTTAAIAVLPGVFPYSVADHTRWLSIFTVGLIVALPTIMALTHAIIERNHERRIFGVLLIWTFFIATLPVKLIAHAQLIRSLSRLATPSLFLVFGPALDIFLLTALYSFIVTWRHNPAGA